MAKKSAGKLRAKKCSEPREGLREAFGAVDYAVFEKGARGAVKVLAKGTQQAAEAEGQTPCTGGCRRNAGGFLASRAGRWSPFTHWIP